MTGHQSSLQERAAKAEDNAEVNSKTFRVKRKVSGGSPLKAARRTWATTRSMRGAFYFEGDSIISHQYNLDVRSNGVYNISIKVQRSAVTVTDLGISLTTAFSHLLSCSPLMMTKAPTRPSTASYSSSR